MAKNVLISCVRKRFFEFDGVFRCFSCVRGEKSEGKDIDKARETERKRGRDKGRETEKQRQREREGETEIDIEIERKRQRYRYREIVYAEAQTIEVAKKLNAET